MSITDVYDIREINRILQEHGIDDEETLARTFDYNNETPSTASSGGTILSSAQTGQTTHHSADAAEAGSTAPLSITPSMIDSSLSSFLSSLSNSNSSHDSVSSISSQSTPRHSPESFQSIGRFLSTDNDYDGISVLSLMSSARDMKTNQAASEDGRKWWEQVEDWDSFTADAEMYLKVLLMDEMTMKSVEHSSQVQGSTFFGVWQWFQGLFETITNVSRAASNEEKIVTERAKYVSSLIKQIVALKKELEDMPPEPPTIPEDLKLDDVPDHIRQKLIEHHARVNVWRNATMQQRKQMEEKFDTCKGKLLACIIDAEEEIFWKKECDKWGSLNDDGYVEVVSKKSSVWDDSTTVRENKSVLSQYATIFAGAIGAGLVIAVSTFLSKRRGC